MADIITVAPLPQDTLVELAELATQLRDQHEDLPRLRATIVDGFFGHNQMLLDHMVKADQMIVVTKDLVAAVTAATLAVQALTAELAKRPA